MSKNFTFETVRHIRNEWGIARRLGEVLREFALPERLLLVTDKGLHHAGVLDAAKASLAQAGFAVAIYDDILPDPSEDLVLAGTAFARDFGAEAVLSIGGGSSMDVAKVIAVLLAQDQQLDGLYGIGQIKSDRLPLVLMPTTSGTGSEVTNISILTRNETQKMGIVAPQLYADYVLLDAELTLKLPAAHTAASGIDAMVHAIEAYTTRHRKNPMSDALAKEALRLLAGNIVTACRDGANREAREAMLLGAMLAGQAFSNAPVAAVHALAYPLGGHYHIPHGLSNALMLAPVLRFNAPAAAELYGELAQALFPEVKGGIQERCAAFIGHIKALAEACGAPQRLSDVGVKAESLPLLARDAMLQTRLLGNNPVEVTEADALRLYQEAF